MPPPQIPQHLPDRDIDPPELPECDEAISARQSLEEINESAKCCERDLKVLDELEGTKDFKILYAQNILLRDLLKFLDTEYAYAWILEPGMLSEFYKTPWKHAEALAAWHHFDCCCDFAFKWKELEERVGG